MSAGLSRFGLVSSNRLKDQGIWSPKLRNLEVSPSPLGRGVALSFELTISVNAFFLWEILFTIYSTQP